MIILPFSVQITVVGTVVQDDLFLESDVLIGVVSVVGHRQVVIVTALLERKAGRGEIGLTAGVIAVEVVVPDTVRLVGPRRTG